MVYLLMNINGLLIYFNNWNNLDIIFCLTIPVPGIQTPDGQSGLTGFLEMCLGALTVM
jgi:hypothetical protein